MMTYHQIAYLNPWRTVAWKCLSLPTGDSGSGRRFAPVAYASRSPAFLSEHVGATELLTSGPDPDAVLWVVSSPAYRAARGWKRAFPPTLTARIVVRDVLTGDVVRDWADDPGDMNPRPPKDDDQLERWRTAESVADPARRAAFRIARVFAGLALKSKRGRGLSPHDAWNLVRVAMADRNKSAFLAHIDATACLAKTLGRPDLAGLSVAKRVQAVGHILSSPRGIKPERMAHLQDLEQLAQEAQRQPIFMSYRWNERIEHVVSIGNELLKRGRAIWLDRLAIPDFGSRPRWKLRGRSRAEDPATTHLERLLDRAIDAAALFLALACEDHQEPPRDRPTEKNWAQKELDRARRRFGRAGRPRIAIVRVDRGAKRLDYPETAWWRYDGDAAAIAQKVDAALRSL